MPLFVARFPPYILKDHASPKRPRLCTQGTQTELSYCTVAEVLKVTDVTAQVTACIDAGTCGEGSIEMRTGDVITGAEGFKKAGDAADATEAAVSPVTMKLTLSQETVGSRCGLLLLTRRRADSLQPM